VRGFLIRAAELFHAHGITSAERAMTDNAKNCRLSRLHAVGWAHREIFTSNAQRSHGRVKTTGEGT
jgi:hypothetical protein